MHVNHSNVNLNLIGRTFYTVLGYTDNVNVDNVVTFCEIIVVFVISDDDQCNFILYYTVIKLKFHIKTRM